MGGKGGGWGVRVGVGKKVTATVHCSSAVNCPVTIFF